MFNFLYSNYVSMHTSQDEACQLGRYSFPLAKIRNVSNVTMKRMNTKLQEKELCQ